MTHPGFILVSGALGRLGAATSRRLLATGHRVVGIDVRPLSPEAEGLWGQDHYVHIVQDLVSAGATEQAITAGTGRFGPVVGAVHAAYPRTEDWGTRFEDLKPEALANNLFFQLGGSILFSQSVVNAMRSGGRGSIVFVSSIQGVRAPVFEHYEGLPMYSPAEYSAIKAGLIGFSRWLAKSLAGENIRVNCVSPGGILADQPPEFKARYLKACLNKGLLDAEDVVGAITFLLSEDSEFISGQNLIVDDGWSL